MDFASKPLNTPISHFEDCKTWSKFLTSSVSFNNTMFSISRIAEHFNTNLEEYHVIFTSGATAAAKLVSESFEFTPNGITDKGTFAFLVDNHTSIVGMREIASDKGANICCIQVPEAKHAVQSGFTGSSKSNCNNLFVYPAQSNFSGDKYPLDWIQGVHDGCICDQTNSNGSKWYVFLDAACFVSTNQLDLDIYKPDFVCISFYKIFGYPTGLGALLVHHEAAKVLKKTYFGGGTVSMSVTPARHHVLKETLHDRPISNVTVDSIMDIFQT
ncbi:Molybdenum cofactor sulfurase [Nymphon striatum]|nr:Molybdenum cofactor sulfurase [Nymphon striatum]